MAPNKTTWTNNASSCNPSVDMAYVHDNSTNANLSGTWSVSFKATSSASSITFTPYYSVSYYYEYGN